LLEAPDLLVCTGDFVDGMNGHIIEQASLFNQIGSSYGKFAVTGNHEYYTGLNNALKFIRQSGFTVLQSEAKTIGKVINIVGVDDPAIGNLTEEKTLLSSTQNGLFTLFLKHRPLISEGSIGAFDLQLSGHTHGGQIYPFKYLVSLKYPLSTGLHQLNKGSQLYISRGSGTWGPQMRILSPPEVTVIELINIRKASD
jgi:predicted MPP superfamily phosphohydrolase